VKPRFFCHVDEGHGRDNQEAR